MRRRNVWSWARRCCFHMRQLLCQHACLLLVNAACAGPGGLRCLPCIVQDVVEVLEAFSLQDRKLLGSHMPLAVWSRMTCWASPAIDDGKLHSRMSAKNVLNRPCCQALPHAGLRLLGVLCFLQPPADKILQSAPFTVVES